MKETCSRIESFESGIKIIRSNIEKEATITESKLDQISLIVFKKDETD
jgi:hypothetical protein